jgi:DNA-binding beta-propeller fold protein YncE
MLLRHYCGIDAAIGRLTTGGDSLDCKPGILGRTRGIAGLTLFALTLSSPLWAATGDTVADAVLGQRRFTTAVPFFVDGRIFGATDVAVDRSVEPNRLYLADSELNRVLGWSDVARFRAGAAADLVLGQPTPFTGATIFSLPQCPVPSATSFCRPARLAVDPSGNLYVADAFNGRVLELDRPFATDRVADRVFGVPDFSSRGPAGALDVAVDAAGNLWMLDPARQGRILEFDAPTTHDTQADRVIAPPDPQECVTSSHRAGACSPVELTLSPGGDLYVQDDHHNLFVYRQPLATDLAVDFYLLGFYLGAAFDPAGDLYVSSFQGLQRFTAPIAPETLPQDVFQFSLIDVGPGRLDFDAAGTLYLADGAIHVFAPPYSSEPARVQREAVTNRGLDQPDAVAVDRTANPNHLYAFDATGRVLGWRDAAGFASGAPADLVLSAGIGPLVNFTTVLGLAVDPRGNLWVADGRRVVEFNRPFATDAVPDRILGRHCNAQGTGSGCLGIPGGLAFDRQGRLYVADLANNRVLLFADPLRSDLAARVLGQAGFAGQLCNRGHARPDAATLCLGSGESAEQLAGSGALAVDRQGDLYVADSRNSRVLIFKDPWRGNGRADAVLGQDGSFTSRLAGTGARRFGDGSFSRYVLGGLALGPQGDLYVADTGNARLLVFMNPLRDDTADRIFGSPSLQPTAASLAGPTALAFDAAGDLFVADTGYNRVLRFDRP